MGHSLLGYARKPSKNIVQRMKPIFENGGVSDTTDGREGMTTATLVQSWLEAVTLRFAR
jgi:hypothetical protein